MLLLCDPRSNEDAEKGLIDFIGGTALAVGMPGGEGELPEFGLMLVDEGDVAADLIIGENMRDRVIPTCNGLRDLGQNVAIMPDPAGGWSALPTQGERATYCSGQVTKALREGRGVINIGRDPEADAPSVVYDAELQAFLGSSGK
jgi:hypothetical protein